MIISEQDEKKPGWEERISSLKQLKKHHTLLKEAYEGQGITKDFDKFRKDYIDKLKMENSQRKDSDSTDKPCLII
jgi:hypothetical protein